MRVERASVARVGAGASVWLALRDDAGRLGRGEACPMPGRSTEGVDACEEIVARVARDLVDVDEEGDAAAIVERALAPFPDLAAMAAARFALETALLDLLAQARGVSIAEALGGARQYHAVAINGLLNARTAAARGALVADARRRAEGGIRAFKIKIPAAEPEFTRALDALAGLRAALPDVELRVDANEGFALQQAAERLARLAPIGVRYVEQPVGARELLALGDAPIGVAADESLALRDVADALLEAGTCAAFVLKPTFLGLLRARELAERAAQRGIAVVVTHAFEGPIAFAAACELSLSLSRPPLACGLEPHDRLSTFPAATIRQLRSPGLVLASDRPGLGVVVAGPDV